MILFIVLQFFNVIISTIKYIVTVQSNSAVAAIINALSYTINAVIVYYIVSQEVPIVIIVTFLSNLIGVPIGKAITKLFTKSKLWIYDATIKGNSTAVEMLHKLLKDNNIVSVYYTIEAGVLYNIKIFSNNKVESRIIKQTLKAPNIKYHITESI